MDYSRYIQVFLLLLGGGDDWVVDRAFFVLLATPPVGSSPCSFTPKKFPVLGRFSAQKLEFLDSECVWSRWAGRPRVVVGWWVAFLGANAMIGANPVRLAVVVGWRVAILAPRRRWVVGWGRSAGGSWVVSYQKRAQWCVHGASHHATDTWLEETQKTGTYVSVA